MKYFISILVFLQVLGGDNSYKLTKMAGHEQQTSLRRRSTNKYKQTMNFSIYGPTRSTSSCVYRSETWQGKNDWYCCESQAHLRFSLVRGGGLDIKDFYN